MKQDAGAVRKLERVCVFCGSSGGNDPAYLAAARGVGRILAQRGITLVFGGGRVGMMGAVAEGAFTGGGKVIGVIPAGLVRKEKPRDDLTELHITQTMHERKQKMAELADGFIALPGGFGTFEEFCEIITWAQLGIHTKPCGLLNVKHYYAGLLTLFDHAQAEGFLRPQFRRLVLTADEPEELLAAMERYREPAIERWLTPQAV
jgi:uncharacterized protein (TIGR00730 family)